MRFSPFIYHTYKNKWEAGSKTPPLYKVMLFTRRNGVYKEYMPLKIGFGKTELVDGRIMRRGKELKPVKAGYNAAGYENVLCHRTYPFLFYSGTFIFFFDFFD